VTERVVFFDFDVWSEALLDGERSVRQASPYMLDGLFMYQGQFAQSVGSIKGLGSARVLRPQSLAATAGACAKIRAMVWLWKKYSWGCQKFCV